MNFGTSAEASDRTVLLVDDTVDETDDTDAFVELFRVHHPFVRRFLYAVTSPDERVYLDDFEQETFIRLWVHLPKIADRDERAVRAWIVSVARNLVHDFHRSAKRRAPFRTILPSDDQISDAGSIAMEGVETRDLCTAVLQDLTPAQKEVFVLFALDFTSPEVGTILGMSSSTARSHYHRALPKIRAAFSAAQSA